MILAANYLDIKSLLDLTCAKVASMIKGKNTEEIRTLPAIGYQASRDLGTMWKGSWCLDARQAV